MIFSIHTPIGLRFACLAAALSLMAWSERGQAGDHFWTDSNGGSFDNAFKWDPSAIFGSGDPGWPAANVNFDLAVVPTARYTVTDVGGENARMRVHNDSLELAFDADYRVTATGTADPSFVVGAASGDVADVILSGNGTIFETRASSIGHAAGSTGILVIDNLEWTTGWHPLIGNEGSGTVVLQNGAQVSATSSAMIAAETDSTGSLTVDGSIWNGRFITVGVEGSAAMTIQNGGTVSTNPPGTSFGADTIGRGPDASGIVSVNGASSTWTSTAVFGLYLGDAGYGELAISNGGVVSNVTGTIGRGLTGVGKASITGADSSWNNDSRLIVGELGAGEMIIENGGQVSNTNGYIGYNEFSATTTGSVTLTGPGSSWQNNGSLYIAGRESTAGGPGLLTIGWGASVVVDDTLKIWDEGTVNLHGGTIRFDGYDREPAGTFNFLAGTIQLAGDRQLGVDPVIEELYGPSPVIPVGKGLTIEGAATFLSPVTLDGGTLTAGGLVGASLLHLQRGTLHITDETLTIGGAGAFGTQLDLGAGQLVQVDAGATVDAGGRLTLASGAKFVAPWITSDGVIAGSGDIHAQVYNSPVGEIRAAAGDHLLIAGSDFTNDGRVEAIGNATAPAEIEFDAPVTTSASTGMIAARQAMLRFNEGLDNRGALAVSFGTTDIFGDVTNNLGGSIAVGGGAQVTFYDDLEQNGSFVVGRVGDTTSTVVLFGAFSGGGGFLGGGNVYFMGDLRPGNSTAAITLDGNVFTGAAATTLIEIAGVSPGAGFDQINVSGELHLDGNLAVTLLEDFVPSAGDQFQILTALGGISGAFADITLPALTNDLFWDIQYGTTALTLTVAAPGLEGDFNHDGAVDAADYVFWRKNRGTPQEYDQWRANFGRTAGGGAMVRAAVPEPTAAALLLVGAMAILPVRRTR